MKNRVLEIGLLLVSISAVLILGAAARHMTRRQRRRRPECRVRRGSDCSPWTPEQFPLAQPLSAHDLRVGGHARWPRHRSQRSRHLAGDRSGGGDSRATGDIVKKGNSVDRSQRRCRRRLLRLPQSGLAEALARTQLERVETLYKHGANSLNDLQVPDTENRAKVDLETTAEHLRLLGNDPDKPQFMVNLYARLRE